MTLAELGARFYRAEGPGLIKRQAGMADAHGVLFTCPACAAARRRETGSDAGAHRVLLWFADRGAPADALPAPRWRASGTGVSDLTLEPSVHLTGPGCGWHGFVRNGSVVTV